MALIACPECGKEFSDKAPACPGCGCPTQPNDGKQAEKQRLSKRIFLLGGCASALLCLLLLIDVIQKAIVELSFSVELGDLIIRSIGKGLLWCALPGFGAYLLLRKYFLLKKRNLK